MIKLLAAVACVFGIIFSVAAADYAAGIWALACLIWIGACHQVERSKDFYERQYDQALDQLILKRINEGR